MIPITVDHLRVYLHLLGATVWVGGQIALAGVVPVLRRHADPTVVRAVARRFQMLAWPAFALLLATGVWNLVAINVADQAGAFLATLMVKLVLVALSGLGAAAHAFFTGPAVSAAATEADQRRRRALSGATAGLGLLFAVAAALFGVQL